MSATPVPPRSKTPPDFSAAALKRVLVNEIVEFVRLTRELQGTKTACRAVYERWCEAEKAEGRGLAAGLFVIGDASVSFTYLSGGWGPHLQPRAEVIDIADVGAERREANAALIAVAPELLKLCREVAMDRYGCPVPEPLREYAAELLAKVEVLS